MLLRNIDQNSRLYKGIRLIDLELANNVIEAIMVTWNHIGDKVYIPRINMIPSHPEIPLRFQRR